MPTERRKDGAGWRSSKEERFYGAWKEESPFGPSSIPEREFLFHEARKWRFDFAWPSLKVAVEIQGFGGNTRGGGHHSITGLTRDAEKTRAAILLGWTIIPVTSNCLSTKEKTSEIVTEVAEILEMKGTQCLEK